MGFDFETLNCSERYRRRFEKRAGEFLKRNVLWDLFLSKSLIMGDLNAHLPIHRNRKDNFSPMGSLDAHDDLDAGAFDPAEWTMFTNPLRIPATGPDYPRSDGSYAEKWERPSERPAIGHCLVFTLEHDPEDPTGFQTQLEWLWDKGDKAAPPFILFDAYLRENFKDYRGYTVVWTGNKSLHFHLVFDPTWLDRAALDSWAVCNGHNPKHALQNHYEGDINPDVIWEYYKSNWRELASLFQSVNGTDVLFDDGLITLSQKRRFPWGTRTEEKTNNIHGFPEGTCIPQIVLEERLGTTSPKGATGYFLRSSKANAMEAPPKAKRKHPHIIGTSSAVNQKLLDELTQYLAREWGAEYPRPACIDEHGGVYFYNHAGDRNPSTYLGPDYTYLAFRGKSPPEFQREVQHLPS